MNGQAIGTLKKKKFPFRRIAIFVYKIKCMVRAAKIGSKEFFDFLFVTEKVKDTEFIRFRRRGNLFCGSAGKKLIRKP